MVFLMYFTSHISTLMISNMMSISVFSLTMFYCTTWKEHPLRHTTKDRRDVWHTGNKLMLEKWTLALGNSW